MIGNLGKVAYTTISYNNENNGNGGNIPHESVPMLRQQKENLFPWYENRPGTVVTRAEQSTHAPNVPKWFNETGNNNSNKNFIEKPQLTKPVPVVLAVPVENRVATDKLPLTKPCYCCKGKDYWLAGTEQYPHWICRKCHPPAPGAEKIIEHGGNRYDT